MTKIKKTLTFVSTDTHVILKMIYLITGSSLFIKHRYIYVVGE